MIQHKSYILIYQKYIKRILDIIFSFIAILVLSPIMITIAILVRTNLGTPIIFKQKRPGKNENIFEMYKFRSMTNEKDSNGNLLPDELRLSHFGKKLRETSLDELPELFNILKGDMSIVGPRPQLIKDMVFMTPHQRKRHTVLPGLTGLAQINGRNNIAWDEKIKWDLQYIQNISFHLDLAIIVITIYKVLKRKDIATNGLETSEDLGDYLLRTGKIDITQYTKTLQQLKYYCS